MSKVKIYPYDNNVCDVINNKNKGNLSVFFDKKSNSFVYEFYRTMYDKPIKVLVDFKSHIKLLKWLAQTTKNINEGEKIN